MEPPLTPADRLTAALIAVPVLVDAAHGVLNAIFRPFSGLFDDALHTLHALGVPAVLAGILLAGWRLVGVAWARRACLHPAWLVGSAASSTRRPWRSSTPATHSWGPTGSS